MIDIDQIQVEEVGGHEAIQLVNFVSQTNKFELSLQAKEFLSQLKGNIAFVVVCGRYRTGKSFLLNRLIDAQNNGFKVNPSTNSCTQGIWLYTKPLINRLSNLSIYFIDTEGSESGQKSQTHEAKIFALSILLSCTFIFNSKGCIDESAIEQLYLTTQLSKHIQVQEGHNENNESILGYYTPKFIWVLRDFMLEMKDPQGRKQTPKEYLEWCLHDDKINQTENSKKVRQSLLKFFKDRHCYPFVQPIIEESKLQKLDILPFNQLREEFQKQLIQLRDFLLSNCQPKQINGVNLNGRMYCKMIETYITILNKGGVPNISTAWEQVVENECQQGYEQAKRIYENNLKHYFGTDEARSFEDIFKVLKKIRDESFQMFHQIAGIREKNNYFEEFKKKLMDFMTDKETLALKLNDDMNNTKNEEVINEAYIKLKENLQQEQIYADNIDSFFQHFNEFLTNYDKKSSGTEKANTLIRFLQIQHPVIIKSLMNSTIQKYSKNQNLVEQEKAQSQLKEKQHLENIKILEQSIQQQESKIKNLDKEKVELESQKNKLQETLNRLQAENVSMRNNIKNIDDLQHQIAIKQEEVQNLQAGIQQLQVKKKKKGCCG